jgi:hypothetical protein
MRRCSSASRRAGGAGQSLPAGAQKRCGRAPAQLFVDWFSVLNCCVT